MINDEQIKQVFVQHGFKLSNESGDDLKPYVYKAARDLIALAQEVKPLVFKQDEDGDYCAKTILGEYWIYAGKMFIFRRLELKTLEEAIEAANADFRKRALSCLVNGGV